MTDRHFMRLAIELAAAGIGNVSPNPAVGAVLVRDGKIIGEGYHARFGGPHAETECIRDARRRGNDGRGATMYCTLEPCSFHSPEKHNPRCTDALIAAGVSRLVVAARDPNPAVSGCGVRLLRDAGVHVTCGLMEQEVFERDESYFLSVATGRPAVHLKWAQSLNGRIARAGGGKTAISGAEALRHTHGIRAAVDAIIVGRGTLDLDNPALTVRYHHAGNREQAPLRVALDPRLQSRATARMFDSLARSMVFIGPYAPQEARDRFEDRGVGLVELPVDENGRFAIGDVLGALYTRRVRSVLVEGGAVTHKAFFESGLWDRLTVYVAPILLDGDVAAAATHPQKHSATVLERRVVRLLDDTVCISGLNPEAAERLQALRWDYAEQGDHAGCTLPIQEETYVYGSGA